jgi:hypothetical protein
MQALTIKLERAMSENTTSSGKRRGGFARADSLTSAERRSIASNAAKARWETVLQATHGSPDHPLKIGEIAIPCYVLEDGTRVLSQRGLIGSLGMGTGADRLASFLGGKSLSAYVSNDLTATIQSPIKFRPPHGGVPAFGYPATVIADICDAVLAARGAKALQSQQEHIARQCEILIRGFARVGIIALVDEATGYEKDRVAGSLARILEAFIAKELQPWVRTFPADYYQELFRLRGLSFSSESVKRPQYFGVLTNDIVYKRLAPGVLEELKKVVVKADDGRPKHKLFQKLTSNIGYPKLREHLGSVVTLMKLSKNYEDFKTKLDLIHPAYGRKLPLPLMYEIIGEDDGNGI